jgi:sugar phosphate isomerase/epimerase
MRLDGALGHLTYCLNIHPAETWQEVKAALVGPVADVKRAVAPGIRFDVGLRLSGRAVRDLGDADNLRQLKEIYRARDYGAMTVNGFPYGPFHGTSVKESVYQPDWRTAERLAYTNALATIMADLAVADKSVSLSTVPGTFKPLGQGAEQTIADNLLCAVGHCVSLHRETGVVIALAIEPEPFCLIETIDEAVAFFRDYLFGDAAAYKLCRLTGLSRREATDVLPRHLGLCYDVCHAAVEFEDPAESIATLREAGIPVHKLQLSAALRIAHVTQGSRDALRAYDEPTYLHQVVARSADGLSRDSDLPQALARGDDADGEEWRVHFHVPVFVDELDAFGTTQDFLAEILTLHRKDPISTHLEIETYTWDVLPERLRQVPVEQAIVRELNWVLDRLS